MCPASHRDREIFLQEYIHFQMQKELVISPPTAIIKMLNVAPSVNIHIL